MKAMPYALKQKLRQYDKYTSKAKEVHDEISEMLEGYGVPYEHLTAQHEPFSDEPTTESLTFITHSEGYIEENIKEIERVFLHFANKENQTK
ncbi:hypothetical protein ABEO66_06610 [Bacillus pacificus]